VVEIFAVLELEHKLPFFKGLCSLLQQLYFVSLFKKFHKFLNFALRDYKMNAASMSNQENSISYFS